MSVVPFAAAALAAVLPPAPVCVDFDVPAGKAAVYVSAAVEVLRGSGHDPASYAVTLRAEEPFDGFVALGRRPPAGVLFQPRPQAPPGDGYPLRVSPLHPCVVAWTDDASGGGRRAEVLRRAEALLEPGPAPQEVLQVLESREHYRVEVWDVPDGTGEPTWTGRAVTLRKVDLHPVYNQEDSKPTPGGP